MTATLAVRRQHTHRWIYIVLFAAARRDGRAQHRRLRGSSGSPAGRPASPRPSPSTTRAPSRATAAWRAEPVALPCDRCQGSECLRALAPFRVAQQMGRTIGYGFAAPPWPGWYSKWVWVAPPSAFPLLPVYPTTSPWAT